jgi:hypothetical protein
MEHVWVKNVAVSKGQGEPRGGLYGNHQGFVVRARARHWP